MPAGFPDHRLLPASPVYSAIMVAGIVLGGIWWMRQFRAEPQLAQVYAGAIVGAFSGAKLGYLVAEGWLYLGAPEFWISLATGKTVLGALLGGYLGVELAKWLVGYRKPTGDRFATIVPLGIAGGRLGCLAHGCCLGVVCEDAHWFTMSDHAGAPRWPAPVAEMVFNLLAFAVFVFLRRRRVLAGQHFHLYLVAYGVFRCVHEFARATPVVLGSFSGYQFLALAVVALGAGRFCQRQRGAASRSCWR